MNYRHFALALVAFVAVALSTGRRCASAAIRSRRSSSCSSAATASASAPASPTGTANAASGAHSATCPTAVPTVGTPEYDAILDELVTQNRQGVLALGGDCYLHWKGQRVLVKAPAPDTE